MENKDKILKKIDLLLEDIKKNIEIENETHRTCFNNDLLAIRIKEIKKMIEDENN